MNEDDVTPDVVEETQATVKFGKVLTNDEQMEFRELVEQHFLFKKEFSLDIEFEEIET